ncbi:MAG: hypothetical protein ACI4OP_02015 [Candidatus Coprovivens sp.]
MESKQKIIEKIEKQANKEYNKVVEYAEKLGDIRCNDNDIKLFGVIGFGALAWAISMIAMPFIVGTGALPDEIIQPLFVTVPALAGIGGSMALQKGFKNKERLRKRTSAKKQEDRTAASTKLLAEKEKHAARMYVLDDAAKKLKEKNTKTPTDDRTQQEMEASIRGIEATIEEKLKELDLTTTKQTLKERFWRVRDKNQILKDTVLIGLLSALAGFIIYNIPLFAMHGIYSVYNFSVPALQLLAPGIITGVAATGFAIKHKNDELKAFRKVNKELLGDEALPESIDDSAKKRKTKGHKVQRFDLQKLGQSNELVELITFLAREKEAKDTKYGEESILFQDFEPVKVTEATRQHVLDHPEKYQNCQPRIREGNFYTDDEYERRAEEVLSTPLPGEDDKGIAFTKKDKRK